MVKLLLRYKRSDLHAKKHDSSYPTNAINFCLSESGLSLNQIDNIAFYDKPFLKFERLLETYVASAPKGLGQFILSMPVVMREKLFLKNMLIKQLKKLIAVLIQIDYYLVNTTLVTLQAHFTHPP